MYSFSGISQLTPQNRRPEYVASRKLVLDTYTEKIVYIMYAAHWIPSADTGFYFIFKNALCYLPWKLLVIWC